MNDLDSLLQGVLAGQRRSIARALTIVERGELDQEALLAGLQPHLGQTHVIGITGAPGSGKSTLTEALANAYRQRNVTVGIIAVDPSSPLTGGALLGDRIRMSRLSGDRGVFIRSMASRGQVGGLAQATVAAIQVLAAAGFDKVIVETVGAGQDEVDIARVADSCVVVQVPNAGDDIQAIKAGQLEIADLFVVNKADQNGAERAASLLRAMIEMAPNEGWTVPVLQTVAIADTGIEALLSALQAHDAHARQQAHARKWQRPSRTAQRLLTKLATGFLRRLDERIPPETFASVIAEYKANALTEEQAVNALLDRYEKTIGGN